MKISVIIPHFNQECHLDICLQRLHKQEGYTSNLEIIVVDNGSHRMPDTIVANFPGVLLIKEETPGPGPARNLGVSSAQGDILAFIDADCQAHGTWLREIQNAFSDYDVNIIGGEVLVGYIDPRHPTFLEPYEAIYSYRNKEHIAEGFSGTGNLAVRRPVLDDVGPFAGIGIAEDRDWGHRANALGYEIRFVAEMIVYHPARNSFSELTQKWDRHISHDYHERLASENRRTAKWILKAAALAVSPIVEIPTIICSNRISGINERFLAFGCLYAIRMYRSFAMIKILIIGVKSKSDWER